MRTMSAVCFVCNLPILSHQVGLVWQGGNGWDDLVREQVEESTLRQRLGTGRRDSAAQITSISPPTETQETSPPITARRRRSSLAQLTDILREWGGSSAAKARNKEQLTRRETLADIAKSLPWAKANTDVPGSAAMKKRRESSADSGVKSSSSKSRQDSHTSAILDFRSDLARLWSRKDSTVVEAKNAQNRRGSTESTKSRRDSLPGTNNVIPSITTRRESVDAGGRRGSGESAKSGRRDSLPKITSKAPQQRQHNCRHHRRRQSQSQQSKTEAPKYYRDEQRPSTSSTASDSTSTPVLNHSSSSPRTDSSTQALPPPTIITSSVTPPATSPMAGPGCVIPLPVLPTPTPTPSAPLLSSSFQQQTSQESSIPSLAQILSASAAAAASTSPVHTITTHTTTNVTAPTSPSHITPSPVPHQLVATRRDSTTQVNSKVYMKNRRDSRGYATSPERRTTKDSKYPRLPRQSTAIDESSLPSNVGGRRGSQPTLSPDPEDTTGRKARRDSLSPDSAGYGRNRRDSRTHLSPERNTDRDISPVGRTRRGKLRRQSTTIAGYRRGSHSPRSPESSSTCSSRDPSPGKPVPGNRDSHAPSIRRQSTTEEILIARGFRRQSTTEEMIRCRNFRRQSSQSDDCSRYRGRRDSSAQITDGTLATMTVETTSTFFDSSTQTGKILIY
ncbi:uncharacterized protein PB18E9.04c [Diaphorina citri]|uniref:Uncharacterized protein PB18E9.04c n=1 Tax=Diaphorina citri TaxID=121845 RepID=A0A3Q0IM52_DIACI|nr:uncharacterized protein PB18E9.04c [Diaphorina citri]